MKNTFDVLLVDDNKRNIELLESIIKLIKLDYEVKTHRVFTVSEAVEFIEKNNPDILLLDIELTDGSGFDILENVETKAPVIFITAHDRYAVKAFKVNAIDYVLKPIGSGDLRNALNKAVKYIEINENAPAKEHRKLSIRTQYGFEVIDVQDIILLCF